MCISSFDVKLSFYFLVAAITNIGYFTIILMSRFMRKYCRVSRCFIGILLAILWEWANVKNIIFTTNSAFGENQD